MPIPVYPEIVLTKYRPEIFSVKEVLCTEKLHGSNWRVCLPCGMSCLEDIGFGSREVEYKPGESFPLGGALQMFKNDTARLTRMWEVVKSYGFSGDVTFFGEVYGPGVKAKGIKYSTGQTMLYRGFDIQIGDNLATTDMFVELMEEIGLSRVHEVWRGAPSQEAFDALLEKPSTEGRLNGIEDPNNISEGVVIRSYPLLRNVFGEYLICKHKSRKFAEVTPSAEPKEPRSETPADVFAATYVTEGRVRNAVGRLNDRGTPLAGEMRDMPTLLDEIIADLHKEAQAEWDATETPEKAMRGAISRVLGPLYRNLLTETG